MSQTALHRAALIEGRVFCRDKDRVVRSEACLDCSRIRAVNEKGTSPFIVCDTSRTDEEDGGQRMLAWWLKRNRRPSVRHT